MQLTRNNARAMLARLGVALSPSRSAMAEHGRRSLVAGMAAAGFWMLLNAAAAEPEGTVWTKYNNTTSAPSDTTSTDGRIPWGTTGTGDDGSAVYSAVIGEVTYKMWYGGYGGAYRIYYATSPDGLTWTKYTNAIPANSDTTSTGGRIPLGTAGQGDDAAISYPAVIKDENTYKMWYAGSDGANLRIYYATSPDGLTWTKYTNAVPANSDTTSTGGRIPLGTAGQGDDVHAAGPAVIKDGNTYKMWYSGHDGVNFRIYYATSPDGLTWTKYTNAVPANSNTNSTGGRIPLGAAGKGDEVRAAYPGIIKVGYTYYMWYSGLDNSNWQIYHARILPPAGTIFSFR